MYKVEWGQKFICPDCSQKFYSMGKTEGLTCPACNSEYDIQANRKLRNNQMLKHTAPVKPVLDDEVIVPDVDVDVVVADDDVFVEDDDSADAVPLIKKSTVVDDDDTDEDNTPVIKSTSEDI